MIEANTTTAPAAQQDHPTQWLVFSCAFPSARSTPRVAVWRRLRRSGAVALKSGLYILPATDECIEAMQWLAQEARAEGADPIVIRAEVIEGLTETQIVDLFHDARREDYGELLVRAEKLERQLGTPEANAVLAARSALERLRADHLQVHHIDYFATPEGRQVNARIDSLAAILASPGGPEPQVAPAQLDDYQGRIWVTRPRPFVDRLACAWLIRRFIDRSARIRYGDVPTDDEVAFDMNEGAFGHIGNRCSFEVIIAAFGLHDPALTTLGEIVHELDLQDRRYVHPEVIGLESVLAGWRDSDRSDESLEAAGSDLFDGVYRSLQRAAGIA